MKYFLVITLAWRNLWRHPRRTWLLTTAVSLGVWSMVLIAALSRGSLEQQVVKAIANLTAHVQVHAAGYRDDPSIDYRLPVRAQALETMRQTGEAVAWSARVRVPAVVASEYESSGVTVVGIDPEMEKNISFISKAIVQGRFLDSKEDIGIVVGRRLAERLETELGRRVVITGQDVRHALADRGFRIVGIFQGEPKAMETQYVFVSLGVAQALFKMKGEVSEIAPMTHDRNNLGGLLATLRAEWPKDDVAPWTDVEPLLVLTETISDVFMFIWFAIVFVAMSFGLVNTLLMAIFERTREMGLLQALGMAPKAILAQVLFESLFLLMLGLVLGNLLAFANLWWLSDGLDLTAFAEGFEMIGVSPVIIPRLELKDWLSANVLVAVLGVLASLYPAYRAARINPREAMTRI